MGNRPGEIYGREDLSSMEALKDVLGHRHWLAVRHGLGINLPVITGDPPSAEFFRDHVDWIGPLTARGLLDIELQQEYSMSSRP